VVFCYSNKKNLLVKQFIPTRQAMLGGFWDDQEILSHFHCLRSFKISPTKIVFYFAECLQWFEAWTHQESGTEIQKRFVRIFQVRKSWKSEYGILKRSSFRKWIFQFGWVKFEFVRYWKCSKKLKSVILLLLKINIYSVKLLQSLFLGERLLIILKVRECVFESK
jgi:hypothetical protein